MQTAEDSGLAELATSFSKKKSVLRAREDVTGRKSLRKRVDMEAERGKEGRLVGLVVAIRVGRYVWLVR